MSAGLPRRAQPVSGSAFLPQDWQRVFLRPRIASFLTRQFARLYYANVDSTVFGTRFLGVQTLKYPTDLWVYQEVVSEILPEFIVETGTWHGGSALYLATICEALGRGTVITIDPAPAEPLPQHPRIDYVRGSSTDPDVVAQISERVRDAPTVVILDADHSCEHVLAELGAYSDIVSVGSYLIVEDTNVNGKPVLSNHGPGPGEAVAAFLRRDDRYAVDASRERLLLTANPGGFLRRSC